jgi:hypothetical protein
MPKGCKTCSSCGYCTGPRAYVCPQCHSPFAFKAQSKEKKSTKIIRDFNWRELVAGDRIKVTGGPYYIVVNLLYKRSMIRVLLHTLKRVDFAISIWVQIFSVKKPKSGKLNTDS